MKKILFILVILLLAGCSGKNEENKELSIVVPSGAPSLAFYTEIDNDKFNTSDAKSILPELKSENGSDIIVIDTINGIKAIQSGAQYKMAAAITFGNFYIASTGIDDNGIMEDGDYIVLFNQAGTPDLIFHYIFEDKMDTNIHYVNAVTDAATCLIKGINISDSKHEITDDPYVEYVMIAEPALSAALAQNPNASVYENIQQLYQNKTHGEQLVQASLFISNRVDKDIANDYLDKLKENINYLLSDSLGFSIKTSDLSDAEIKDIFGIPNSKIAIKVLQDNSIGLGFKKSYSIKEDIDKYISLYGMEETDEEIYFK